MRGNRFTVEGVKNLYRAVYDTSSMNAIYDSNHLLQLAVFSTHQGELLQERIEFLNANTAHTWVNRGTKLMMALQCSSRDAMLCYLEDVPVELMPQALEFMRRNTCCHKQEQTRNIVHAIARWWNMPSLYAFRSCAKATRKRRHS